MTTNKRREIIEQWRLELLFRLYKDERDDDITSRETRRIESGYYDKECPERKGGAA